MKAFPLIVATIALATLPVIAQTARADWDGRGERRHEWREHQWRENQWHENQWHENQWRGQRPWGPPGYVYAPPPPVYYAPAPTYYPPPPTYYVPAPSIIFGFSLR